VNFITSHDGFTLADLVSYERKHNQANGEANRDGSDDHRSWNGGVEGATRDRGVRAARARQARNAAALLLLSRGALLWLWGDETLRTQHGNNNAWCHDGPDWWRNWDDVRRHRDFLRFVRGLLALRRKHAVWRGGDWFATDGPGSVAWHGPALAPPEWEHGALHLVMHIRSKDPAEFLLLVNGGQEACEFRLPPPAAGSSWRLIVNTAGVPPADFTPLEGAAPLADPSARTLAARSLVLLAAR
jgi:glycogen operon protein